MKTLSVSLGFSPVIISIPGGSGSLGQMAVPIAKALGLHVIVSGNARAKDALLSAGADRYIVYTEENYWETLSGVDSMIDTLGDKEFDHELSVLKENGILLSLRGVPNGAFAQKNGSCCTGAEAEKIIRKYFGLPEQTEATKPEPAAPPAQAGNIVNLEDFFG